jgi:hypothetical protein
VAKPGMATDSRGTAPGTTLQTDILIGHLISVRVMTLWSSEARRRYQSIGGSNPSDPIPLRRTNL